MFESLFASKNKKLVLKLQKEHRKIVALVGDILEAYNAEDDKRVKSKLKELKSVALMHLMTEDVEFYRLIKDSERSNAEIEYFIHEFDKNFAGIKLALIEFLDKYTSDDAHYNNEFIKRFDEIVTVLSKRIEFEEGHLYEVLKHS